MAISDAARIVLRRAAALGDASIAALSAVALARRRAVLPQQHALSFGLSVGCRSGRGPDGAGGGAGGFHAGDAVAAIVSDVVRR